MAFKLTDLVLAPSDDYALNSFLITLNDELTDDDLKKLKFLCRGKLHCFMAKQLFMHSQRKYGIGKAKMEKIETPLDLFEILREKELLNEMNLITLQAMLWVLPRRDLQQKYAEFAESLGSSIHFVVPRETPENGYRYLKFHIEGADLEKYDKRELERLRSQVAFLLRVPPEFVIVSGIEPSSSLMITIMLLEDDAQRLASTSPEALAVLSDMFVDYIRIEKRTIPVSATTNHAIDHHPAESGIEKEAREALLRQRQTERELDKAQDKITTLQNELTTAKSALQNNACVSYMLVVLIQQFNEFYSSFMKIKKVIEDQAFNPIDKLQKLCVFANFRHCLNKVRKLGYNEDIIYNLLDAQALVFQWHNHERRDIEIANLRVELAFTTWEKEKLAYYHRLGVQDKIMSKREEFCVSAMTQNLPLAIEQKIIINTSIGISEECVQRVFRQLSQDLTEPEVKVLTKQQRIKGNPSKTAYEYLYKTLQKRRNQAQEVELSSFVRDVLAAPLKRLDLLQNLNRYVSEFSRANGNPQPSGASSKKSGKRKPRTAVLARHGKHSLGARKDPGSLPTPGQQTDSLQEINERLSNIEKSLQERDGNPYGKFNKGSMLENYESFFKTNQLFPPSFLKGKYDSLNPPVSIE